MNADLSQKVCPRCRSIYMGRETEPICPTCQDIIKRATIRQEKVRKQSESPENPLLQCLIQREGTTVVSIGGCHYTFRPNAAGDSVCSVTNPNHHKFLIRSGQYRPYVASGKS